MTTIHSTIEGNDEAVVGPLDTSVAVDYNESTTEIKIDSEVTGNFNTQWLFKRT